MSGFRADKGDTAAERGRRKRWFAAGGALGAVLASSCCLLPLALVSLGVSGAWIGSLTAFEPYKPVFVAIAVVFIAAGFRQVYFRKTAPCTEGSVCARPQSALTTKAVLWASAILVLLALTIEFWAPLFY